jgi:hypothetical protein
MRPGDPPRPDGLYSAAKIAMEAMGRAAAETLGLPVSVLRVGTCRVVDDPEQAVAEQGFTYIGDHAAVRRRLAQSWLSHPDLVRMVREEFTAPETFRLRYAVSSTDNTLWSVEPLTWTTPAPATAGTPGD